MPDKKKNAHSTVGAAERAELGANFASQVPNYNFTTFSSKIKGAGGVRA